MKISIDIDCTPREARAFFGLPDFEPVQDQLVAELQRQLERNLSLVDPESLLKSWLPNTLQGIDDLRKLFGGAISGASSTGPKAAAAKTATSKSRKTSKRRST